MRFDTLAACALALLCAACSDTPAWHCDADDECPDKIASGVYADGDDGDGVAKAKDKIYCHPTKHYCYAGCKTSAQCQDETLRMNVGQPEKSKCNVYTHHCELPVGGDGGPDPGSDGGPDPGSDGGAEDSGAGLKNGTHCTGAEQCASGFCADNVCCVVADCPDCQDCSKEDGTCQPRPAGVARQGECPGHGYCGGNACDGAGQCAYLAEGAVCDESCGSDMHRVSRCDAAHDCVAQPAVSCAPYRCAPDFVACRTTCAGHEECVDASLCDLTQAHVTGTGTCVAPDKIVATTTTTIQAAVNELGARTHIKVTAKGSFYDENVTIVGKTVRIVGGLYPGTLNPSIPGAAITVAGGADVTLQGLRVQGAWGPGDVGVHCTGPGTSVTVIESIINSHMEQGIDASGCNVTVRRSTFESNQGGGLRLLDGTSTLVNNIVRKNGSSSSAFGGVSLSAPSPSDVIFANNTVYDNEAVSGAAAGVSCAAGYTLHNSILWGNTGGGQLAGCAVSHSNVQGSAPPGSGNLSQDCAVDANGRPSPTSVCVDAGDNAAPGLGALDFAKLPRVQGGTIDIGAYEMQ